MGRFNLIGVSVPTAAILILTLKSSGNRRTQHGGRIFIFCQQRVIRSGAYRAAGPGVDELARRRHHHGAPFLPRAPEVTTPLASSSATVVFPSCLSIACSSRRFFIGGSGLFERHEVGRGDTPPLWTSSGSDVSGEIPLLPIPPAPGRFPRYAHRHGFDQDTALIVSGPLTQAGGYEACRRLWVSVERSPTRHCHFQRHRCDRCSAFPPRREGAVTWRSISHQPRWNRRLRVYPSCSLTTVTTPMYEAGRKGFELLLTPIEKKDKEPQSVIFPVKTRATRVGRRGEKERPV